ncbi:MAG: rRNA maturation RNase YbeY [Chthoniobacterales bacterium]
MVEVVNRQRGVRISRSALQAFAKHALTHCLRLPGKTATRLRELSQITIVLVSDRRMAALHRRFLGSAKPTDVMTFAHGEIVISAETAQKQAAGFATSLEHELQLYIAHGLLHLHGYDDVETADANEMARVQEKLRSAVAQEVRAGQARPT